MAEDVVIRYRVEVEQAGKELKDLVDQNKKLGTTSEQTAKSIDKESKSVDKLEKELTDTSKKVKSVSDSTKKFGTESSNVFSGLGSQIKSFGAAAALSLGAFASIDAVIQFGKASVDAFLEAEKNAERLKFAITSIGGESELAFERLINQSERLQKITIFSDDSIQQAQAALSAFGLTANQIEDLIPRLANFATITGTDIPEAASKIGAALEGNGREFKKYGIFVDAAASRTENLNSIIEGLVKFEGSAEAATKTLSGQLAVAKNEADNLQESIGARLAPVFVSFRLSVLKAIEGLFGFNKALDDLKQDNFDAVAKNFEDAAKRIEASGGDLVAEFSKRKTEIEKLNEGIISSNEKLNEQIAERLLIISKSKLDLSPENDPVIKSLEKQIELNNKNLELQKEKILVLDKYLSQVADEEAAASRVLKAEELRLLSIEKLTDLLGKEKAIRDKFSEDNIDLINKELDLKKKAFEAASKAEQEELKKNLALLAKLQIDNIEDLKQKRIAQFEQETKDLTAKGQLRTDIITELEKQLVDDLNEIDKKRNVDPLFRAPENKVQVPDQLEIPVDKLSDTVIAIEDVTETWLDSNQQILESTSDLFNQVAALYANFTNQQIEQINLEKEDRLKAIDEQLQSNEDRLDQERITEVEAAAVKKELLAKRVAEEEKAAKKVREIKRKQAILDKSAALIEITINTARAVSEALASAPPPANYALAAAVGIVGAAEAALVAAQPIPYKKGTKKAKGGLSLVGEEGPELMMLPRETKVLDAKKTKTHSEAIDAMYDNNFEGFVLNRYVNPALKKAKKEKQQADNVTFAENISKSFILNNMGLTEKELEKVRRRGNNINNARELAQEIANALSQDPYRR